MKTYKQVTTPVLFLVFNRLETTKRVFEVIIEAKPQRLYIAADGARETVEGDTENVDSVRNHILENINWPCEVKTLFRDHNLGCKEAVSKAINWFFDHEEMGIILEDDCLPSYTWFIFAEEMLERYKNDNRIMCISASNFPGEYHSPESSYVFSIYNHCWGWATWRRAWQYYDVSIRTWPDLKSTDWLRNISNKDTTFESYWKLIFENTYNNKINSWDYAWTYACWLNDGLTILPSKNLVKNIGFTSEATHTNSPSLSIENLPLEELTFPLSHPKEITVDWKSVQWTNRNHFKINLISHFKRKIRRVINIIKFV